MTSIRVTPLVHLLASRSRARALHMRACVCPEVPGPTAVGIIRRASFVGRSHMSAPQQRCWPVWLTVQQRDQFGCALAVTRILELCSEDQLRAIDHRFCSRVLGAIRTYFASWPLATTTGSRPLTRGPHLMLQPGLSQNLEDPNSPMTWSRDPSSTKPLGMPSFISSVDVTVSMKHSVEFVLAMEGIKDPLARSLLDVIQILVLQLGGCQL